MSHKPLVDFRVALILASVCISPLFSGPIVGIQNLPEWNEGFIYTVDPMTGQVTLIGPSGTHASY